MTLLGEVGVERSSGDFTSRMSTSSAVPAVITELWIVRNAPSVLIVSVCPCLISPQRTPPASQFLNKGFLTRG